MNFILHDLELILVGIYCIILSSFSNNYIFLTILIIFFSVVLIFYRDVEINNEQYDKLNICDLTSPSYGKIIGIDTIPYSKVKENYGSFIHTNINNLDNNLFTGPSDYYYRISIFLSILDPHFICSPSKCTILNEKYKAGDFSMAFNLEKSNNNERMLINVKNNENDEYSVVLFAGTFAKRISKIIKNKSLKRGDKFAFIKFGSRADLIFPANKYNLSNIKIGDNVIAGTTLLAEYKNIPQEMNMEN